MKFNEVKKVIDILLPQDKVQVITPMLIGFPGVGKSSLIAEIAKERGIEVVDLRLSQHDNTDFKFPQMKENTVRWVTADFLPVEGNPRFEGTKGILFLDEMNLASQDVLSSVFQLVYDRRIGDNKILDSWYIVAAGNFGFEDGNDNVVEFSTALRDRIVPIILDKFNLDEWVTYVTKNGCSQFVVDYIKANPTKLYVESKWQNEKVYVTPRRWEKFGLILARFSDSEILSALRYLCNGGFLYGEEAEFLEFVSEALNSIERVDVKKLFSEYEKYEKTVSELGRDKVFQLNSRVVNYLVNDSYRLTDKVVGNFKKYVETLSDDLKISFLRSLASECTKVHGSVDGEKHSSRIIIKKMFDLDKAFEKKLSDLIQTGTGFTKSN